MKRLMTAVSLLCAVYSAQASDLRKLDVGDFAELNDLVSDALIYLGDTSVADGMILNLSLRNLRCTNFAIGDMSIGSYRRTDQTLALVIDVVGLSMDCFMDYDYRTIFFVTGSGTSSVQTSNTASATAIMESSNLDVYPPTSSFLESCAATVNLYNLQFLDGGILALAPVESLLARLVESQAEQAICQQLGELSTTALVQLLVDAKETLDFYPADLVIDPVNLETQLPTPEATKLLNLQERETQTGELFDIALRECAKFLSRDIPSDDGTTDMQANIVLRDAFLVERALILNVTDFSFVQDGILWQKEDKLTDTTIYLHSVKLLGLDTMTRFQPFQTVGNHTVQNEVSWEYLMFELNATINIKPSRAPDSVLINPGSTDVVEQITIKFGFESVDAVASFLFAIDQSQLESIQLGAMFDWDDLVSCLASTLVKTGISSLSVSMTNVQEPTLEGFVSQGVDRIVTDAALAAFRMYEGALLNSAPAFFQTAVKAAVNNIIEENLINLLSANGSCPFIDVTSSPNDFVDLRDLLLEPQASARAGGNGSEPYGHVVPSLFSDFRDRTIALGDDGFPKANTAVRSATKAQSGVEGQLNFTEPFAFTVQNASNGDSLVSRLEFISKSIAISGLDSVVSPLLLFDVFGAHRLANSIHLGQISGRPLNLSTDLLFRIEGENSPLAVSNLFKATLSFQSDIEADILATLTRKEFLEFPLRDLANPWCWLAAFPVPELDGWGNEFVESQHRGLQLSKFGLSIVNLTLDLKCISCTSYGGEALPEMVVALRESGTISLLQEHLQALSDEIVRSYWASLELPSRIVKARKTCPSSPYYSPSADASFVWPGIPLFSTEAIESMVMFSALAVNFGMVLTAKSHNLRPDEPTNQLSAEETMQLTQDGKLIDWRDMGGSLGEWAGGFLDEVRAYVGGIGEDEKTGEIALQANILVRKLLENGAFSMPLKDMGSGGTGLNANLTEVRVFGLDSMLQADVLDAIGARTLSNRLKLDGLRLELDVAFEVGSSVETTTLSVDAQNVDFNFTVLLAVDWRKIGTMRVGSVLQLKRGVPCMASKFHAANVTQLLVTAESVDEPRVLGFLSPNASQALSQASRRFLDTFSDDVIASIPKICDITIREVLNRVLLEVLVDDSPFCTYDDMVSNGEAIDFRDMFLVENMATALGGKGTSPYGDTFRVLYQALQEKFSSVRDANQTFLNDLIRSLTLEQSNVNGSLLFPGVLFNASASATMSNWVVSMEGRLSDVRVQNLDSVGQPLFLLQPVLGQASALNNSISVGVGQSPLRLEGTVFLALSDDNELNLRNEVKVTLDVHKLTVVFAVLLAMSESAFFALPLENLQDINCWLSTIPEESLDANANVSNWFQYDVAAEKAKLNISCISCENPLFGELVELLYKPGESEEEVQTFFDATKDVMYRFLGSHFLQNLVRMVVSDAAKRCPASPKYDVNAIGAEFWFQPETYVGIESSTRDTKMQWFNIASALLAFVFVTTALVARRVIQQKNREWLASLPEGEVDSIHRQDQIEAAKEEYLDTHTQSMFHSDQIPRRIRYAVPFVLIFNIVMYIVAHTTVLFYMDVEGQIAGDQFTIEAFLDFTFFGGALRAYHNGGNEMALFLIILSGIWPYVKLILALCLWFAKPGTLSVALRGKTFLWMDALTKLSIIDIVTMLIAIAALLVYIGGPGEEIYNSDDLYAISLVVVPKGGFYCILIAQRLNRVSSRFFLDYHNKIVSVASEEFRRLRRASLSVEGAQFTALSSFDTAETVKETPSFSTSATDVYVDINLESPADICTSPQSSLNDGTVSFCEEKSVVSLESPAPMHCRSEAGDFLFYDPNDRFHEEAFPHVVTLSVSPIRWPKWTERFLKAGACAGLRGRRRMMGGTVSAGLAVVTAIILFIIGCTLAPSLSTDAKGVLGVALESGRTFADAVNDFNLFRVVSVVLLKTRFVLQSTSDYVGLGILLGLAGISMVAFPIMQGWKALKEWRIKREGGSTTPLPVTKFKAVIPGFMNRLKVWNHMEVFVISFCIACWQLCAAVSYLIHNYCDLLRRLYEALGYIGLVERTTANCFPVQASDPFTLLLLIGSFFLLLVSFILQAYEQFKTNRKHVEELMEDEGEVFNE